MSASHEPENDIVRAALVQTKWSGRKESMIVARTERGLLTMLVTCTPFTPSNVSMTCVGS
jgi:hypothetical protein